MRIKKQAKHTLDELYFREWSNEMTYILGLMASDGCVKTNSIGTNATIQFISKDLELVKLIKRAWKTTAPIKKEKSPRWKWSGYRIEVYSKTMAGDLALLGIGLRKTFKFDFPPMRTKYKRHFIRGLLDGDGCVWSAKQGGKIRLHWSGMKSTLETISQYFFINIDIRLRQVKPHSTGRIYELIYHNSKEILEIVKHLYRESDGIRLERKFQKVRDRFGNF